MERSEIQAKLTDLLVQELGLEREKIKPSASFEKDLEVDSLGFLSVDGLYSAMGEGARNAQNPQFTDHAFTGDYPTPGGYAMVNAAYIRWYEGVGGRSYDLPL